MDLFNTLANATNPQETIIAVKKAELATIERQISAISAATYGSDRVSQSFHLGRVGGSGRNVHKLNKQRERDLEKTINNARKITELHKRKNALEVQIKRLESGNWIPPEEEKAQAKEKRITIRKKIAEREKEERKNMTPKERLFIGDFGGGIVYADRAIETGGDYKKLAFLSNRGEITWYAKRMPPELKTLIEEHMTNEKAKQ